jgi:hypothetical protein
MSTKPRLRDVLDTVKNAVQAALAAANAPGAGQVYVGWPTSVEEVQKLGQPGAEGSVTVYPLKGASNVTRYPGTPTIAVAPVHNLIAVAAGRTLTFSGVNDQAYNIHGFFYGKLVDAYYGTTAGQTLAQVATAYAAAITALNVGITASASGAAVTLTGGQFTQVNIGSSGTIVTEEVRIRRTIQVSVWMNDDDTRWVLADIIMAALGGTDDHFLSLSDGSQCYVTYAGDVPDDSSEGAYSMFVHHIYFQVEYGQLSVATGYEIEGFEVTTQTNEGASETVQFG